MVRPWFGSSPGALAGDHHVDAMVAENALQLDDVGEPRNIVEDQGVLGQQAAIIKGSVAFLAPEIGIAPFRRCPPTMRIRSMLAPSRRHALATMEAI